MGHRGRFDGRAWRHIVVSIMVVGLLAGCVTEETLKKQKREAEGHYKQGVSYLETDQQRAFVSFQRSIQLDPENYDAHYALGSIYFERKAYADAEREFRTCVNLEPVNGEALNYLGRALIVQKRLPEAAEVLRKATLLPLYATPDRAYYNLAEVLHLQGDNPGAIQALQSALKIEPPNVPRAIVFLSLGQLFMKQGEDGKAREALAQAKALDPEGDVGKMATKLMQQLR
jgi:type IV pilus biogenesis/stability protein PilW